jgi:hypothetical protein
VNWKRLKAPMLLVLPQNTRIIRKWLAETNGLAYFAGRKMKKVL